MLRSVIVVAAWLSIAFAGLAPSPALAANVTAKITCDNSYSFGYGDVSGISTGNLFGNVINATAGDIYTCPGAPESYTVTNAFAYQYLYLIAWSDDATKQGILGEFNSPAGTVFTGVSPHWKVYATGMDFDGTAPTLADINTQIGIANAATGNPATTSVGWVGTSGGVGALAIGEDNSSAGGNFSDLGCMNAGARWMWYNADPNAIIDPFIANPGGGGGHKEFLIFRIPVGALNTGSVPTLSEWGMVAFVLFLLGTGIFVVLRRHRLAT